ncbi:MAG: agmatine deiminase family protein [Flavobacteriales bacterium]|nr:agmatine deiminase family protein [Flavobacteriales bacterium]
MLRKPALLTLLSILLAAPILAQEQEIDLPRHMAPHEYELIPGYRASREGAAKGITTPPNQPVRTAGEWEEVMSLVITWRSYPVILKQIVRHAKEQCEVIIVCASSGTNSVANVQSYLNANNGGGPPLPNFNNITFHVAATNSVWIRDYGPETMYFNEVDSLVLMDWIYNRPRPQDDVLSDNIGTLKNIAVFSSTAAPNDLVHTGGNFMADGFGIGFSSKLVDMENGPQGDFNITNKTPAQVNTLMNTWMGISPYVKMNELPFDNISHIDMHMKLLDEERLLIGEFPVGVSDGPTLEANIAFIQNNYVNTFGEPYEILRIPMVPSVGGQWPPQASYRTFANAIFINKLILVPTYREEVDTVGLRLWREYMPGYKVVGIDCDNADANIISASGAIHCITKNLGVRDPLLIKHKSLQDTYETAMPYPVSAYIRHKSGIANATLHWSIDTLQGYNAVPMAPAGGNNWAAAIPAHPVGTMVYYYLHATANSGKTIARPITAPQGWWRFEVLGGPTGVPDNDGPSIVSVYPNPTASLLVVHLKGAGQEHVRVWLVDALGREVMRIHNGALPQDGRLFADLTGLAEAQYMLVVENAQGRTTHRVAKH